MHKFKNFVRLHFVYSGRQGAKFSLFISRPFINGQFPYFHSNDLGVALPVEEEEVQLVDQFAEYYCHLFSKNKINILSCKSHSIRLGLLMLYCYMFHF